MHPGLPWWKQLLMRLGVIRAAPCSNLTPAEDFEVALRAASDGDLMHAAHHAAGALRGNPADTRVHALIDRLAAKMREAGRDPLELAPATKSTYAGTAGMRAYLLFSMGHYGQAIALLRMLLRQDDAPWGSWALHWLQDQTVVSQIAPEQCAGVVAAMMDQWEQDFQRNLAELIPVAETLAKIYAQEPTTRMLHAMIVRKAGRLDEACALGDAMWSETPAYATAVGRAMAHQEARHLDIAAVAFEDALRHKPDDSAVRADLALLHCEAGRFHDALRWAEDARQHDPEHDTAAWALDFYIHHRLDRDSKWLEAYGEFAEKHPRHRPVAGQAARRIGPYATFIPPATEAVINVGRQLLEQADDLESGGSINLRLTNLEAPSAMLALNRQVANCGLTIEATVDQVQVPDPRVCRGDTDVVLWRYEGTDAHPSVDKPTRSTTDLVAALAVEPYDLHDWMLEARRMLASYPARADIADGNAFASLDGLGRDIVAVMVHLPDAPDGWVAWDWLQHVQYAAAVLITQLDTGWENSIRRRALTSLVRGPLDWTTNAAIVALQHIFHEPNIGTPARDEIIQLYRELGPALPDRTGCWFDDCLFWATGTFPDKQATQARAPLIDRLKALGD